jgi:hypothetical protein
MDAKTACIRALNDQLRRSFAEGIAVMTPGVAALGPEAVERMSKPSQCSTTFAMRTTRMRNTDFGAFEADGHMIYFKIDYFDRELSMHSPDPADPSITQRVITIMLAEERGERDPVIMRKLVLIQIGIPKYK